MQSLRSGAARGAAGLSRLVSSVVPARYTGTGKISDLSFEFSRKSSSGTREHILGAPFLSHDVARSSGAMRVHRCPSSSIPCASRQEIIISPCVTLVYLSPAAARELALPTTMSSERPAAQASSLTGTTRPPRARRGHCHCTWRGTRCSARSVLPCRRRHDPPGPESEHRARLSAATACATTPAAQRHGAAAASCAGAGCGRHRHAGRRTLERRTRRLASTHLVDGRHRMHLRRRRHLRRPVERRHRRRHSCR